jgi:hypothetical protein
VSGAARACGRRLVLIKQASDLNVSVINQMVIHQLASNQMDAMIAAARPHYRMKRDAMLRALSAHMPRHVTWTRPEGGLFTWLTLPEDVDGAALLERAVEEAKVAFVPGKAFHHDGSGANTIRLFYSLPGVEEIDAGIGRLAGLL